MKQSDGTKPRHTSGRTGRAAPENISKILGSALGSFTLRKKTKEYSAFPYWEEIVGKAVAEVAVPEKIIRGKVLVVRVLDAVWAQELSLKKNEILDGIHRFGKGAVIEDIKFNIGSPKSLKNKDKNP